MTQTYPGMTDESTEFFLFERELKVIQNGTVKSFTDLSSYTMGILKDAINSDKPTKLALLEMHPNSEMRRLEQFATCRFGGLDFQADIKDGVLQDGEFWECPNRGTCPYQGVLCKLPLINGVRLTDQDVELMQLSASELTNEAIADKMNLPLGTFHKKKNRIHSFTGVNTRPGITKIFNFFNLI
jgi:DNA-binding CsgD family transcriptional regulator